MKNDKTPVRKGDQAPDGSRGSKSAVEAFLGKVQAISKRRQPGGGRLILALDATMSRQPTWDLACQLQGEMFDAAGKAGSLAVQLVYFRGFGESQASRFVVDTQSLKKLMTRIDCRGGHTQIGKVLSHCLKENKQRNVAAVVYIGDAVEEPIDDLSDKAAHLGIAGVPVFVFQEGNDPTAKTGLTEIARLSGGAWFQFDQSSARILARLLSSVAVYAAGGFKALQNRATAEDRLLIEKMGRKPNT